MLEKDIEKYLVSEVKKLKGIAYKWISPGNSGVPDRIVFLPDGLVAFVELKAPGKKPTALQTGQHKKLHMLGVNVYIVDSKEAVDETLSILRNCAR